MSDEQERSAQNEADEQNNENAENVTDAQEAEESDSDDSDLDPKVKAKIERANREARALRTRLKELEPKAQRYDADRQKNLSEVERLREKLSESEIKLEQLEVAEIRRRAAQEAGLDLELAEFITASEEDEALEQAKRLAKRMGPTRKSTDMRQGRRGGNSNTEVDRNDLIRQWAGYST